jgi:hypothetical protein
MRKKKSLYKLKTNCDAHYAMHIAKDIINRNSLYTLINYIIWSWEVKPKIKEMDILNVITEEYLQNKKKEGTNEKGNVIKLNFTKLN